MKKFMVILSCLALLCPCIVSANNETTYYSVAHDYINKYGFLTQVDGCCFSGLGYGQFIDFDNDGTDEMLLVYREGILPDFTNDKWATVVIYGMQNGRLTKIFDKDLTTTYFSNGGGVSYPIYIKEIDGLTYLSMMTGGEDAGDNEIGWEKNTVFSFQNNTPKITELYYEYLCVHGDEPPETLRYNFTKAAIDGISVTREEYLSELAKYQNNPTLEIEALFAGAESNGSWNAILLLTKARLNDFLAQAASKPIPLGVSVVLNGNMIEFDQPPFIKDGRTLVPLRAIFEALGATVNWEPATQTITATKSETVVTLTIGSDKMYVNGEEKVLDVPACIINNRTVVPVRAISESFDCNVSWDSNTQTVSLYQ